MEKFKYILLACTKDGSMLNAKMCMNDEDFDYWMGWFDIVDKEYDAFLDKLNRSGFAWAEHAKHDMKVKAMTYDHLKKSSEAYKY